MLNWILLGQYQSHSLPTTIISTENCQYIFFWFPCPEIFPCPTVQLLVSQCLTLQTKQSYIFPCPVLIYLWFSLVLRYFLVPQYNSHSIPASRFTNNAELYIKRISTWIKFLFVFYDHIRILWSYHKKINLRGLVSIQVDTIWITLQYHYYHLKYGPFLLIYCKYLTPIKRQPPWVSDTAGPWPLGQTPKHNPRNPRHSRIWCPMFVRDLPGVVWIFYLNPVEKTWSLLHGI